MPTQEYYVRGDQIATFGSVKTSGNSNGVKVTLSGVTTLGSPTTYFRVVVRDIEPGVDGFASGQQVDIYVWPDPDPPDPPIYSSLTPQPGQFQGRATSAGHQIFTSPSNILIQSTPITPGTVQIGPGLHPLRGEQMPFSSFPTTPPAIPCFVEGTLIQTARGLVPVECVRPGDRLQTLDNGLQPVIWAGRRKVCGLGSMAPVRFEAGTVGNRRKLLVSPQHRMLIRGASAELTFGEPEALAAAAHLVNGRTIRRVRRPLVTYVHVLCEDHQVILAEGAPSESLFPGGMAISAFDRAARQEIHRLFPVLCPVRGTGSGLARAVMPRSAAQLAFA